MLLLTALPVKARELMAVSKDENLMKLFTDGGCTDPTVKNCPNRIMRCVVTDVAGMVLVDKRQENGTNNVAELWAICEALVYAKACGVPAIEIYSDSKTALAWIKNGKAKTTHQPAVSNLLLAVSNLRQNVKMTTTWIPRGQNVAGIYIESSTKRPSCKS